MGGKGEGVGTFFFLEKGNLVSLEGFFLKLEKKKSLFSPTPFHIEEALKMVV